MLKKDFIFWRMSAANYLHVDGVRQAVETVVENLRPVMTHSYFTPRRFSDAYCLVGIRVLLWYRAVGQNQLPHQGSLDTPS